MSMDKKREGRLRVNTRCAYEFNDNKSTNLHFPLVCPHILHPLIQYSNEFA